MNILNYHNIAICGVLLTACVLLASCSGSDGDATEAPATTTVADDNSIRFNAGVWRMIQGAPRRATTYDNAAALQGETEGFRAFIYNAGTTTSYNSGSGSVVKWETDKWVIQDGKHYWPASGNLDFFAYMPATKPTYITSFTYAVNGDPAPVPYFTCGDLPRAALTPADVTKEFVWAQTTGQNKVGQGASGVTMTFKHPFALVKFKLSAASGSNVTVNSITIPDVYRDGTCTLTGTGNTAVSTWSSFSDAGNLVISGTPATNDDAVYLVIPNNYGSKTLTVNATWNDWSNVTKDVSTSVTFDWAVGYCYTYTLTLSKYALKVDAEKFTEQW